MMSKKLLPVLGVLVMVAALAGGLRNIGEKQDPRSSAAETSDRVDVILETSSTTVNPGSQVTVNLVLDSQIPISGIDFTLEFDPAKLRPVSLTNAGALTDVLENPNIGSNTMSAAFGGVSGTSLQGRVTVAIAVFEAISQGSTEVRVRNNGTTEPMTTSNQFLEGEVNRTNFAGMDPLRLTISSGGNQSNTSPPGRLRGDCNSDSRASLIDFAEVVRTFNQNVAANSGCDFDGDGRISLPDFNAIVAAITLQLTNGVPAPQPTTPQISGLEFEAESGQITAPFQVQDGRLFQSVTNTGGIANNGEAHYTVNIPQSGNYIVQGLVCAANINSNSFYIAFGNHPTGNTESWIITPTGSSTTCNWQNVNYRGSGGAESPQVNPKVFTLTQGTHQLHFHGREANAYIDKFRITSAGSDVPTNAPQPTSVPQATNVPQPTAIHATNAPHPTVAGPTSAPLPTPIPGQYPGGVYPNAPQGFIPYSGQGWSASVSDLGGMSTRDFVYGNNFHKLSHWHFEYNFPNTCGGKVQLNNDIQMPATLVRYNDNSTINMCRVQNQGSTYQQHAINLPPCQSNTGVNGDGKECVNRDKCVFTLRASDFRTSTELRFTPNSPNSPAAGNHRWYLSNNFQTRAGYRPNCQMIARDENCGTYHRTIISNYDQLFSSGEAIPTVRGIVPIQLEFNGGCGSFSRSMVFADPNQHVSPSGHISGTMLMDIPSDFKGTFNLNTANLSNGIHKFLFINLEGSSDLVGASGIALLFNVQN